MSKAKLRPCPFCGNEPLDDEFGGPPYSFSHRTFRVHCVNPQCPTMPWTKHYSRKAGAIAAWNRRAKPKEEKNG